MENIRSSSSVNIGFVYLLKISVGPKNINSIVVNNCKVPDLLLNTMAIDIIDKYIDSIKPNKFIENTTIEQYKKSLKKESYFVVEDLSNTEVYNLGLIFNNKNEIENNIVKNGKKERRFSRLEEVRI